jgi:hypothetical protein
VALNELPKELRQPDKSKERSEWVHQKAEGLCHVIGVQSRRM